MDFMREVAKSFLVVLENVLAPRYMSRKYIVTNYNQPLFKFEKCLLVFLAALS